MITRLCVFAVCSIVASSWPGSGTVSAQSRPTAESAYPQPGDRIVVQIFGEERVADTVTISQRGTAVLRMLGSVDVSAFTNASVADTLRARYARYLRNPTVDVQLLRRIAVNGEVKKPDVYYVDLSMMLPDAIARAGGVAEGGNPRKVSIVRGSQTLNVPNWDAPGAANTDLRSGDLILVGRRSWWNQNFLAVVSTSAAVASLIIALTR